MTEDMIREYETILESLGCNPQGSKLRARMQSAQLVSDMEAFKAANPHCNVADFVRWHSPRDFIIQPDGTGILSDRMIEPGNLWQELWHNAARVPASQQKLLFDPDKEMARVFEYLENVTPQFLFAQLMPTIILIIYETMSTHPMVKRLPCLVDVMNQLARSINSFGWETFTYIFRLTE
jgi:hypothetical protein